MPIHNIYDLEKRHENETIFIIGSGVGLLDLSASEILALGKNICIGVNRTQYVVRLTYFISSYISEVALAKIHQSDVTAIHSRPVLEKPLLDGIFTLKRFYSEEVDLIQNTFGRPVPTLITRNNVIFLATHLALVMGARKIFYVGVDQRSSLHFYEANERFLESMAIDMSKVIAQHHKILSIDHSYANPLQKLRSFVFQAETLKKTKFYETDHTSLLQKWFQHFNSNYGVEFFTNLSDSVVHDAGARIYSIEAFTSK